jgi:hypothetical protein
MEKILFFGYGANRSKQKIKEIIGREPDQGVGAVLKGYTLNVQNLTQIPTDVQNFLQKLYGNEFKAYTLKKGQGIVVGVIWELNEEDLEKFKEWEFIGAWRELVDVEVETSSGDTVKVLTEKSMDKFPSTFIVDGLIYDVFAFSKRKVASPDEQQYYTQKQITTLRNWLANHPSNKR